MGRFRVTLLKIEALDNFEKLSFAVCPVYKDIMAHSFVALLHIKNLKIKHSTNRKDPNNVEVHISYMFVTYFTWHILYDRASVVSI